MRGYHSFSSIPSGKRTPIYLHQLLLRHARVIKCYDQDKNKLCKHHSMLQVTAGRSNHAIVEHAKPSSDPPGPLRKLMPFHQPVIFAVATAGEEVFVADEQRLISEAKDTNTRLTHAAIQP